MKRQHWIQMIVDCAETYKDKLSVEELLDILAVGSATGDGRLDHNEIKEAVEKAYGNPLCDLCGFLKNNEIHGPFENCSGCKESARDSASSHHKFYQDTNG